MFADGVRPAPEVPLAASTMTPVGSITPCLTKGSSAMVAAVT
jgi:hypothetical protein